MFDEDYEDDIMMSGVTPVQSKKTEYDSDDDNEVILSGV